MFASLQAAYQAATVYKVLTSFKGKAAAGGVLAIAGAVYYSSTPSSSPATGGQFMGVYYSRADSLAEQDRRTDLLEELRRLNNLTDAEWLWRMARVCRMHSQSAEDDEERLAWSLQCAEYARESVNQNPESPKAHLWLGIGDVLLSDEYGKWSALKGAPRLKESWEKALELSGDYPDPTVLHLLGRWHYFMADMGILPWMGYRIMGGKASGSLDEAITYFLKAEQIAPGSFSTNLLWIGKSYLCRKQFGLAAEYLRQASEMPMRNRDDAIARAESEQLLESIQPHLPVTMTIPLD